MLKNQFVRLCVIFIGLLSLSACVTVIKAELKLKKAKDNLASQKYDEAISLYKEYLMEKPASVVGRSRLGFAYLKTGNIDQAIEEFNTVLKAEPGEPYSILYLGIAYLNKGDYTKTITTWQAYRNSKQPLVEKEIKRLMTLVLIAESQQLAKKAIVEEDKLQTVPLAANTVAVCYYQDLSPDKSMLAFQKGLAAMVITDLSKIESLNVIERLRLQALLEEMNLGQTGIVDAETAPRVGRLVGAENLVVGNLTFGINAATSLASASKENVMGSGICTEKRKDFFKLPFCIVQEVADILKIDLKKQPKEVRRIHTKNYDAFIYFGSALHMLDTGNWQKACDLFTEALKEDPQFLLAKNWVDNCPSVGWPSIFELKNMTVSEFAAYIESYINAAMQEQNKAGGIVKGGQEKIVQPETKGGGNGGH
jgi:tetratricopeptide (TPR) repeat protein